MVPILENGFNNGPIPKKIAIMVRIPEKWCNNGPYSEKDCNFGPNSRKGLQ